MSDTTFNCGTCGAKQTAPRDQTLALLQLCKPCAEKRYRKGKAEERKALASSGAGNALGETNK